MIPVSKPFLPPQEEYQKYLESIWSNVWLTNNGPLVQELENKLSEYLKVNNLLFTSNGTIALQLAIKAFGLTGEIITTPFSYVATTSTISWENCQPVYVDIDRATLGIDVNKIEDKITAKTSAILATHVYGYPSYIEDIAQLAKIKNLKLIYDGAHAFGCTYKNKSLLAYGDVSTCSFHATKVFHTIEGGCTIAKDPEIQNRIKLMRNFGHKGFEKFECIGINGKNSEFHAAMGLCNLKYVDEIINRRKNLSDHY
ncbi:UNVERIFIED_CONTAM: hypothetical protein GTU68_025704, partial [Idotea baltica]|nr:hypothetical protein [Idotea baltica]